MKNKIDDALYKAVANNFDYYAFICPSLLMEEQIVPCLKKYILLTHAADRFKDISPLEIFYNRYYNFLLFQAAYLRLFRNDDLNLRQQEFKIIEAGDTIEGVDWAIVEQISNEVNLMS